MYQGDAAIFADVGMGIHIIRLPVGRPAGVANPQRSGQFRPVAGQLSQHMQPPLGLFHLQSFLFRTHSNPRRIIAAVLHAFQSIQQNGCRFFFTDKSNNTTHKIIVSFYCSSAQ